MPVSTQHWRIFLILLPTVFLACSCSKHPPPTTRAAKVLEKAAPAPAPKVTLAPIKKGVDNTDKAIREANDKAKRAEQEAQEAKRLNEVHTKTIDGLTDNLKDAGDEVKGDLVKLRSEMSRYIELGIRRMATIASLQSSLKEATEKLDAVRSTHVPRAQLDSAVSEVEKLKLRDLSGTSVEVVEELEKDLKQSIDDASTYKTHYDSRWSTYFKISGASFATGVLFILGGYLYLRLSKPF